MKTDRVLSVLLSSIGALAFSVGYADDIDYGDGRSAGALNWTASLQREVDDLVDAKREALGIPGFAVGITFRDSLVYAKGYGVAGTRSGEPVTPETLFCVGSVSKAIPQAVDITAKL
ncbi:MAG: serine hydrolase domain-containing protein [Pseudomonadota bacterium]